MSELRAKDYVRPGRRGYTTRLWVTDPDGGRRQVRVTAPTWREFRTELNRVRRDNDLGLLADPQRLTVSGLSGRWLTTMGSRIRPRTHERYAQLLRDHVIPRIGGVRLAKLRPAHVQVVIDGMAGEGMAARSIVQAYRVLSELLKQGVKWQVLAVNPAAAVSPPRPGRPVLTIPDAATVGRVLVAAEGGVFHAPLVLAASTGMRRGEVLGLAWRDVDLEGGLVRVNATLQRIAGELALVDPKTDRSRRTVMLPPFAVAILKEHRAEQAERRLLAGPGWTDRGLVFDRGDGRPLDPGHFSHVFHSLAIATGCPEVRLHDLRHAFATTLLASGRVHPKVVSEALGHASVGFTMDVYASVLPSMQQAAAEAMQEALGGVVTNL
jgi:integrase